jgi:hypothetical protein
MTAFASWHPVDRFGPLDQIAVRERFADAETDTKLYNHCDANKLWRTVRVQISKEDAG